MAPIEVTISSFQAAIVAQIKAQFPAYVIVEFDREETDRDQIEAADLPAVLLDLTEFEPEADDDPGTGQMAMRCRLEARVIIGYRTAAAKTTARGLAGDLATWLRLKRFTTADCLTEPAHVIGAYKDDFQPGLDRYVVWRVEWTQIINLGTNIYYDAGGPVPDVLYGIAPDIGLGNEDKYQHLFGPAPGTP